MTSEAYMIPLQEYTVKYNTSLCPIYTCSLANSYLVSFTKIGTYPDSLLTFYNFENSGTSIGTKCKIEENTITDNKNLFYNYRNSKTFKKLTEFNKNIDKYSNACFAQESFNFKKFEYNNQQDLKEETLEEINFVLGYDTKENENKNKDESFSNYNCLEYGLSISTDEDDKEKNTFNLLSQLKSKDKINLQIVSIFYDTKNKILNDINNIESLKGKIIIGDYPHTFDSNNYFKSQLIEKYTKQSYKGSNIWKLDFEKVYIDINGQNEISEREAYIDPNLLIINAPDHYLKFLKEIFFDQYIEKNICHEYKADYLLSTIYCDKSNEFNLQEIRAFPSLKFFSKEYSFIFELTYEDLFVEKNNKYYLLIDFIDTWGEESVWKLGFPFLYKYQFTFNLDSKQIGFYNKDIKEKTNNDEEINRNENKVLIINRKHYSIVLIIVVAIIFTVVGIIFGKTYFAKIKKKRANELKEDFDYVPNKIECQLYTK